jgi:hypothetical protein
MEMKQLPGSLIPVFHTIYSKVLIRHEKSSPPFPSSRRLLTAFVQIWLSWLKLLRWIILLRFIILGLHFFVLYFLASCFLFDLGEIFLLPDKNPLGISFCAIEFRIAGSRQATAIRFPECL